MKYKAVIADVDGTIIKPSEVPASRPTQKLIEAVAKVREKGVVFSIATGRSLAWVEEIIKSLNLESPIILDNGARIYDGQKREYIWESLLSKESAKKVLSVLQKDRSLRLFIFDGERRLNDPTKIDKWKISKILVLGLTPRKAEVLYQKLKIFSGVHVAKTVSGISPSREAIHVTNYEATKQVAILKLAEYLSISTKEIIGIGDSYNDFPLLMACGLKVAMANATPDIKAIADYIAPSYEEDGVVDVLERFILKSKIKNQKYNSKIKINKHHNLSGENKNQLLILVDKHGKPRGLATREECHKREGKPHLAFLAFVLDREGKIILARRSKNKSLWGGFWDASVASHILPGETLKQAAQRRIKEELGIKVKCENIGAFYYSAKYKEMAENEYCYVLIGHTASKIVYNPVEISEIKKIKIDILRKQLEKNPDLFTPWLRMTLEMFLSKIR